MLALRMSRAQLLNERRKGNGCYFLLLMWVLTLLAWSVVVIVISFFPFFFIWVYLEVLLGGYLHSLVEIYSVDFSLSAKWTLQVYTSGYPDLAQYDPRMCQLDFLSVSQVPWNYSGCASFILGIICLKENPGGKQQEQKFFLSVTVHSCDF